MFLVTYGAEVKRAVLHAVRLGIRVKGEEAVAEIGVVSRSGDRYLVTVKEGASETTHEVTVTPEDVARYAGAGVLAEKLLRVSFEFLLERESKESILSRFELPVIERYFPEYAGWIRERV